MGSTIFIGFFLISGLVILPILDEVSKPKLELIKQNEGSGVSGGNTIKSGDNSNSQSQSNGGDNAVGQQ